MTAVVIVNALLCVGILFVVVAPLVWAIMTQHRDHGVSAVGPLHRRWVWSRAGRPHAGSRRPQFVRSYGGRPWPAA